MNDFNKFNKLELEILELRAALERAIGERDRARSIAVALEQELALIEHVMEEEQ